MERHVSKQTIEWHRESFKNFSASVEAKRKDVERRVADLERNEIELEFYRQQITKAEDQNLGGFDSDRFMVKRTAT
jgi:hypothetical protein